MPDPSTDSLPVGSKGHPIYRRLRGSSSYLHRTRLPVAEFSLGILYLVSALLAIVTTRTPAGAALVWPSNAIAAAALIRFHRLRVPLTLSFVGVASILANVLGANDSLPLASAFTSINLVEVGLMTWAYRSLISFPIPSITVMQATHMTALFGLGIPALLAIPGGALIHQAFGKPWLHSTLDWWLSDALGACIFGPPIILSYAPALRRLTAPRFAIRNLAFTVACLVSCYVAICYVRFPFAVMSVPLLVAAFSLGGFGTSVLSVLCGITVLGLWIVNVRPGGLDPGVHPSALDQLPLWALISTLMPPVAVGIGSDERRQIVSKLRSSEKRFRQSLARSPLGAVIVDLDGAWEETNAALQAMLGYSAEEFRSLSHEALTHPDDHEDVRQRWEGLRNGSCEVYDTDRRFLHKNGTWIWTRAAVSLVRDDEGRPLHYIAQLESLESRRATERALAQEQELLKTTLRAIGNGVVTTDSERRITYMNAAARDILGQALAHIESRRFDEVVALTDPKSSQPVPNLVAQSIALGKVIRRATSCVLHRPDGTASYVMVSVSPLFGSEDRVTGAVIVLQDATEQYQREHEMTHQARHDALTGLANRFEYQRRAKRAFERARMLDESAAVIAIDLDRFKAVNDEAGHAAGDAVLMRVAEVLKSLVRRSDTVARLGGDEFAVILQNCSPERTSDLASRILAGLNPLHTQWQGATYSIGASVGVALVSHDIDSEEAWLAAADQACYSAKRAGRGMLRMAGPAAKSYPRVERSSI